MSGTLTNITTTISGAKFADGATLSGTWTANYDSTATLVSVTSSAFTISGPDGTNTFTSMGTLPYANTPAATSYEIHNLNVNGTGRYNALYVDWKTETPSSLYEGSPSLYTSVRYNNGSPIRLVSDGTTGAGSVPVISGLPATESGTDTASIKPFAGVTITDLDPADSATIVLSSNGDITDADGTLSGTGLTKTGTGTYSLVSVTPALLTTQLQTISFTPTKGQVANGGSVATGIALAVNDTDGSASASTIASILGVTCFCAGTSIRTPAGEIAVEHLRLGDRICTADGNVRPVQWIGFRHIDLLRHPDPRRVVPICIKAGALADGVPCRDLRLSPDHAVLIDGLLIPARLLRNDVSIVRDDTTTAVTYFHIELDAHDVVQAEGLTVESYLDTGNRNMFENAGPVILHPDFTNDQARREIELCAPFVVDKGRVKPIWDRIACRTTQATTLNMQPTIDDPDLRLVVGGQVILPCRSFDGRCVFVLPRHAKAVRLISRTAIPCEQRPWIEDQRELGIRVLADRPALCRTCPGDRGRPSIIWTRMVGC